MSIEWAGFIIGLVGLFPLVQAVRHWTLDQLPTRRLLEMSRSGPMDIVLTTNGTEAEDFEGGVALAHYTVVGDVRAVASVSRILSRSYPKKPALVHMSEDYPGNPSGDVVLIGGPRLNRWSRHFMEAFNRTFPVHVELDAEARRLQIGDLVVENFDQRYMASVPTEDLGIVIMAPWGNTGQRVVLCGGFSTYGTEAAARFAFSDLLHDKDLLRRINHAKRSEDAIVIGVHVLVEARFVQQTSVMTVDGRELIWTGSRSTPNGKP